MRWIVLGHKQNVHKTFKTKSSVRYIALFLCLGFVVSLGIPPYTAYAQNKTQEKKLPQALSVVDSATSPATDVKVSKGDNKKIPLGGSEVLAGPQSLQSKVGSKREEIVSKRTATTKTFDVGGGQVEVRNYLTPVNYREGDSWKHIDTSLVEDTNAAESTNVIGKSIAWVKGKTQTLHTYKVKAND